MRLVPRFLTLSEGHDHSLAPGLLPQFEIFRGNNFRHDHRTLHVVVSQSMTTYDLSGGQATFSSQSVVVFDEVTSL
jgi:hypothetical protein